MLQPPPIPTLFPYTTLFRSIDIGIDAADRKAIAGVLARLLADDYTLYLKTHSFHWNVTGPMFNALHAMFMTQYNELDRKSTRLNSSHMSISYAVFCLKKKNY